EISQLLGRVRRVLPTQCRVGCWGVALAVRGVAADARRQAFSQLATAVQGLTTLDQSRIGGADTDLLAGVIRGDISQVLFAERVQHGGHFQHLAAYAFRRAGGGTGLDVLHLLEQVTLTLARQLRSEERRVGKEGRSRWSPRA